MTAAIRIPPQLLDAVEEDGRDAWLRVLPDRVAEVACDWELEVGDPYLPGGQCGWVAPASTQVGDELVLKVAWRHPEAEHEADGLRFWDGAGAVRCYAARTYEDTSALLLERCVPGAALNDSVSEPEQDVILAGLLRRLWENPLPVDHAFGSLAEMCGTWSDALERDLADADAAVDRGLAREGIALLTELAAGSERQVLLATDLHAGNVLSAAREPWLVIDPKPFVGDPAFDAVQHMLNCDERLARDPAALARRMAELLEVDAERVRLWLFARCAQESLDSLSMRELARRLAPRG